ncbi:hypothetical protein N7462_005818 [Penicillium macrosclerotiorum]|uniref:uncharacterized protein n=1 Tax=Penicillium macrosclerotiorum TaxID=303699 RepID=UPI0025486000|nr:uncharacterized protein N7462_005818 [Penicillium macrosclerotiorum]KAJ5682653.1 hypothetical protein N7462_005818 [Penicillium macrosclerotiorum]
MSHPSESKGKIRSQPHASNHHSEKFRLGVEVEFLLIASNSRIPPNQISEFSKEVASSYNDYLDRTGDCHPRMYNSIEEDHEDPTFSEWSLGIDKSINTMGVRACPLESTSPIFGIYEGSKWREDINFLWEFLTQNYQIPQNDTCGTHIHLSRVEGYSLQELKKIAQSVIHFEAAWEALLPEARRCNEYAKSNWVDNYKFATKDLTREASLSRIQETRDINELVLLMHPYRDKRFGWNFVNLSPEPHSEAPYSTIEYRRGPSSTTAKDVFVSIEIAMSFIEAAIQQPNMEAIAKTPQTVGGLKMFIQAAHLPNKHGLYDSGYLKEFFANTRDDAFGLINPYEIKERAKHAEEINKELQFYHEEELE